MNSYLKNIYTNLETKYYYQKEYLDAIYPFLKSINDFVNNNPEIEKLGIIERLIIPDRIINFKVPWVDDKGIVHVNNGYRVQFNNAIGPYKGGTRFSPTVNESVLKFLAFEQTFKNSLTGLPLGGAKGGADLNPKGLSDFEIMRFCQSYITELYKYIGPSIDIPAGDLGVGKKEIGYLYGMYKKLTNKHNETFTGKSVEYGGSLARPEATGYGLVYITDIALKIYHNTTFKNKTVIISGTGQVAIHAAYKARELGAIVLGMSSSIGTIYDEAGIDIDLIKHLKENNITIDNYIEKHPKAKFINNPKALWKIKANIVLPSATQNEIDEDDAKTLIENKVLCVAEGANKPLTNLAAELLINNKILFIPSKAANAGGVATSSFEMTQNATNSVWTFDEVDQRLQQTMEQLFNNLYTYAKKSNELYNLEKIANITAFNKLYLAMKALGV